MIIKKNISQKLINTIFLLFILIYFISCASIPERLLPHPEDDSKILLEKARDIYKLGYDKKSIEIYEDIIKNHSQDINIVAWAYYESGFILFNQKKWRESLKNFYFVVENYKVFNPSAYILSERIIKRIIYAYIEDDFQILLHNSSYIIPSDFSYKNELVIKILEELDVKKDIIENN